MAGAKHINRAIRKLDRAGRVIRSGRIIPGVVQRRWQMKSLVSLIFHPVPGSTFKLRKLEWISNKLHICFG